jgi:hypothetical protein
VGESNGHGVRVDVGELAELVVFGTDKSAKLYQLCVDVDACVAVLVEDLRSQQQQQQQQQQRRQQGRPAHFNEHTSAKSIIKTNHIPLQLPKPYQLPFPSHGRAQQVQETPCTLLLSNFKRAPKHNY